MQFPERFAIKFALMLGAVVFLFGVLLNSGTNSTGDTEWLQASVEIWWLLCKLSVFPIWIIMRVWILVVGVTAGLR